MSLKIVRAPERYSMDAQARANQAIEAEDLRNRKKGADVELGGERLILRSPNGTRYSIVVSNAGVISAAVAVP